MSQRAPEAEELRELGGVLEHVRHHNPEDGWTVARLRVGEGYGGEGSEVAVVGCIAEARPGMEVTLWGDWQTHPQYGDQFRFLRYEVARPITPEAIEKYLAGGAVKGVGEKRAAQIVARFGAETLRVLDEEPERLAEIKGISKKKAREIGEEWRRQREDDKQGTLVRLQGMGVSSAQAIRIYAHYGNGAVGVVEQNPYQLAMEVEGIGFRTADRIARACGTPSTSPFRLQAGITHALQEAAQQGHCFLPKPRLLEASARLLECEDEEALLQAHDTLCANGWVKVEEGVELRFTPGQPPEGRWRPCIFPGCGERSRRSHGICGVSTWPSRRRRRRRWRCRPGSTATAWSGKLPCHASRPRP